LRVFRKGREAVKQPQQVWGDQENFIMRKTSRGSAIGCWLFSVVVGMAGPALAGDVAVPPKEHPDSSDWQPLFESDLSEAQGQKEAWTVRDNGMLKATEEGMLWSGKEYEDFILDLEFKNAENTNSGVVIHCSDLNNWIPNSIEVQIADDYGKWEEQPATWHCGAIFGHKAPKSTEVNEPGEWNRMTVTSDGPRVYVMLNGVLVTEIDRREFTSAEENPDGSDIPPWLSKPVADLPQRGYLGLQGKHGDSPVWFRNLRVKELSEE